MNMFAPHQAKTPEEYIASLEQPRRSDIQVLHDLVLETAPELAPKMWGSMIGYGSYHYKYASGREGDWFVIGLSARKNYISFYATCVQNGQYIAERYKAKLPKADIGKSCIRFKKLEDADLRVLAEIVRQCMKITTKSSGVM